MGKILEFLKKNYDLANFFSKNIILAFLILLALHLFSDLFDINFVVRFRYVVLTILALFSFLFFLFFEKEKKANIEKYKIYFQTFLLLGLILITIGSLDFQILRHFESTSLILNLLNQAQNYIVAFTIISAFFTFYFNSEEITAKEIREKEKKHSSKFYTLAFLAITIIFLIIKISIPITYTGSYIDEYNHIFSGIEFFETGQFMEKHVDSLYLRGAYVSVLTGLLMKLFGETIFVAKMLPAIIGIINYFILYQLCRKIFNKNLPSLLVLATYTFIPWFIFNHFYIRTYVFFELFILIFGLLFTYLLVNIKNTKKLFIYTLSILTLAIFSYLFSNDSGIYMILIFVFLCFSWIYFFEIKKIKNKYKFIKILEEKPLLKSAIYLIPVLLTSIYLNAFTKMGDLLFGQISYSSGIDFKYDNLFFNNNAFFSIFFLGGIALILNKNIKGIPLLFYISTMILFIIHLVSAESLQITRAIVYLLPFFYLFSIFSLSKLMLLINSNGIKFLFLLFLAVGIFNNYPANFFKGPHVPTEVSYMDYKAIAEFTNKKCEDGAILALIHNPYIFTFYDVDVSYTSFIRRPFLEEDDQYFYDQKTQSFYTTYGQIKTISNIGQINTKIMEDDSCIIISENPSSYWRYFDISMMPLLEGNKDKKSFGYDRKTNVFH